MDDKKKMIILVALAVVIVGVGAFQFVKSGDAPAPEKAAVKSTDAKKATTSASKTGETTTGEASTGEPNPGAKLTEGNKGTEATKADGTADTKLDPGLAAATKLASRDPFDGTKWDQSLAKPTTPPPAAPTEAPRSVRRSTGQGTYAGGLKPMPIGGILPEATPNGGGVPLPNGAGQKMPSIDDFPYTVSGTVMGERPCVVITENGSGQQKLVPVGGSIDGDSQVVSISKGMVTVRHRGKTKSFPVGGINPSEKKDRG